ncbi:O-fucosyltransferase 30 [Forsythia ovata]|uniref:O-fucosyltransferase 30 n=1 Tax=Forsythia ovata TaxID=205694 RepID=A0ABD1W6L5_9LAMI
MDSTLHFNRTKWKKRPNPPNCKTPLLTFFILLFCIVFFISSKSLFSTSIFQISTNSKSDFPLQCTTTIGAGGSSENFLWYAPHSGFSNQLSEFKNAILMAAILNRTLIVPPVLDHHAVALGSCPKFRVLNANDLRFKVWNHSIELIIDRRQNNKEKKTERENMNSGSGTVSVQVSDKAGFFHQCLLPHFVKGILLV